MQLSERHKEYWSKNLAITGILLFIWFVVTFVVGYFARELNSVNFFGWPLRLLHGRAGLADHLRGHHLVLRAVHEQPRPASTTCTKEKRNERRHWRHVLGRAPSRVHLAAQEGLHLVHRRLPRLRRRAGDPRADGPAAQLDRLHLPVRHRRPLRRHRRHEPDVRRRRVLRRGTARAGAVQRHGDRRRLDERGVVHRHGRHALPHRLRRPRVHHGLDRRLLPGRAVPRALPAQVRPVHDSRLPRRALRRQHPALRSASSPRSCARSPTWWRRSTASA